MIHAFLSKASSWHPSIGPMIHVASKDSKPWNGHIFWESTTKSWRDLNICAMDTKNGFKVGEMFGRKNWRCRIFAVLLSFVWRNIRYEVVQVQHIFQHIWRFQDQKMSSAGSIVTFGELSKDRWPGRSPFFFCRGNCDESPLSIL